jgi:hypothetical protein
MNKPENFRKIDDKKFKTPSGYEYKFSTDGRSPELWVFRQPDTTNYVLAFVIDWENETYEIKRAGNGKGTNWIDTIHQGNYTKQTMKSIDSFTDWVRNRVRTFETEYD